MKLLGIYLVLLILAVATVRCAPGADGQNGAQGPQGASGPAGAPGNDGQNATPTELLPLCPGQPQYPQVFIEYAMCIQGDLYGVYSANGGFLALLPPGAYSSQGIGSACNFTIGANCAIRH